MNFWFNLSTFSVARVQQFVMWQMVQTKQRLVAACQAFVMIFEASSEQGGVKWERFVLLSEDLQNHYVQ